MAEKKATPESGISDFIDFESQKTYSGKIKSFGKLPSNKKDGNFFYYMTMDDGKKVAISSVIGRKLRHAVNEKNIVLEGAEISITFEGKKITANKYNVNLFSVYVNGELIDENSVSSDEIQGIFAGTTDDLPF